MASQNPLSVPGGWNKDSPAVEENNPNTTTVPRTAAGVVGSSGEIVTEGGSAIGQLKDSESTKDLEGKAVTATGDVVDDAGEVLGKAVIDQEASEYTTEAQNSEKSEKSGGWNVLGKTKGAFSAFGSAKSAKDQADNLTKGVKDQTDNATDGVKDQANNATGNAKDQVDNATGGVQGLADTATDATKGAEDKVDETKDDAPEVPSDGQDPIQLQDDDKTEGVKDGAEGLKDDAEGVKDDAEVPEAEAPEVEGIKDDAEAAKDGAEVPDADGVKDDAEAAKDGAEVPDADGVKDDVEGVKDGAEIPDAEAPDAEAPDTEGIKNDAEAAKDGAEVPDADGVQDDDAKDAVEGAKDDVEGVKDDAEAPEVPADGDEKLAEGEEKLAEGEDGEAVPPLDYSALKGTKVNKAGNLVNDNGDVIGRIVEGEVKKLVGKKADENGEIWNDAGKVVGKAEPLPDSEREDLKDFAPFENFPDAIVEADGRVTSDGKQVGQVVEGDPKRLKGSKVDEDGDIIDRRGNVVGKAEAWDEPEAEEPEPEPVKDLSILAGKRVNKAGNVVDSSGQIFGRLVEGNASALKGRMCDKDGNVRSESGDIVGKAEVVPEGEREGSKEGPFAELEGCTVAKDGKVVTPSGDVVGRLTSGDPKVLFGRSVDEDGDVLDKNGNQIGKAERWEEPPAEEKKKGPMAGRKVNKEGNVLDEDGNIIGKLISGEIAICSGKEVDDDGDVVNSKGQSVGHVSLLEDIPPEPEVEPEESAEDKQAREQAEADRKLAGQLSGAIEQSLEKIKPICKMITDKVDKAERTPKEELDEEDLVKQVKPLIEEAGKILTETNGMIRGMDPDGRIQRNAKHKSSTKEASPEEHHLAEMLKELSSGVNETVENAKRKIDGMPHAKKELNPLWGLLTKPLGQILAAVGLLLSGVLGLVGQLLSGLGLGGLLDGLLGGLGLDKILDGLGLGMVTSSLTGKKK